MFTEDKENLANIREAHTHTYSYLEISKYRQLELNKQLPDIATYMGASQGLNMGAADQSETGAEMTYSYKTPLKPGHGRRHSPLARTATCSRLS